MIRQKLDRNHRSSLYVVSSELFLLALIDFSYNDDG